MIDAYAIGVAISIDNSKAKTALLDLMKDMDAAQAKMTALGQSAAGIASAFTSASTALGGMTGKLNAANTAANTAGGPRGFGGLSQTLGKLDATLSAFDKSLKNSTAAMDAHTKAAVQAKKDMDAMSAALGKATTGLGNLHTAGKTAAGSLGGIGSTASESAKGVGTLVGMLEGATEALLALHAAHLVVRGLEKGVKYVDESFDQAAEGQALDYRMRVSGISRSDQNILRDAAAASSSNIFNANEKLGIVQGNFAGSKSAPISALNAQAAIDFSASLVQLGMSKEQAEKQVQFANKVGVKMGVFDTGADGKADPKVFEEMLKLMRFQYAQSHGTIDPQKDFNVLTSGGASFIGMSLKAFLLGMMDPQEELGRRLGTDFKAIYSGLRNTKKELSPQEMQWGAESGMLNKDDYSRTAKGNFKVKDPSKVFMDPNFQENGMMDIEMYMANMKIKHPNMSLGDIASSMPGRETAKELYAVLPQMAENIERLVRLGERADKVSLRESAEDPTMIGQAQSSVRTAFEGWGKSFGDAAAPGWTDAMNNFAGLINEMNPEIRVLGGAFGGLGYAASALTWMFKELYRYNPAHLLLEGAQAAADWAQRKAHDWFDADDKDAPAKPKPSAPQEPAKAPVYGSDYLQHMRDMQAFAKPSGPPKAATPIFYGSADPATAAAQAQQQSVIPFIPKGDQSMFGVPSGGGSIPMVPSAGASAVQAGHMDAMQKLTGGVSAQGSVARLADDISLLAAAVLAATTALEAILGGNAAMAARMGGGAGGGGSGGGGSGGGGSGGTLANALSGGSAPAPNATLDHSEVMRSLTGGSSSGGSSVNGGTVQDAKDASAFFNTQTGGKPASQAELAQQFAALNSPGAKAGGAALAGGGLGGGGGGGGGGTGGAKPPAGAIGHTPQEVMKYFMSKEGGGWSKAQAAGMAANIKFESNFNKDDVGDGGHALGIGQWHEDRQAHFKEMFGHDIRQGTFEEELQFYSAEMQNHKQGWEGHAGDMIRQTQTGYDAGAATSRYFERPGNTDELRAWEANRRGMLGAQYEKLNVNMEDANVVPSGQTNGTTVHSSIHIDGEKVASATSRHFDRQASLPNPGYQGYDTNMGAVHPGTPVFT